MNSSEVLDLLKSANGFVISKENNNSISSIWYDSAFIYSSDSNLIGLRKGSTQIAAFYVNKFTSFKINGNSVWGTLK